MMTRTYASTCPLTLLVLAMGMILQNSVGAQVTNPKQDSKTQIKALLIKVRTAAEKADSKTYFSCLAADGVFFGTDPNERYSRDELKSFLDPYFAQGIGWKHNVKRRQVYVGPNDRIGWFEEQSERPRVGTMRTTGVVKKTEKGWVIVQYNVSILIPNDAVDDLVKLITEVKKAKLQSRKKESPKPDDAK